MTDTIVPPSPGPASRAPVARTRPSPVPHTRTAGLVLAAITACVSGVSVFANGYGVRRIPDPTTYTTAKNLVAAVLLAGLLLVATTTRSAEGLTRPRDRTGWFGLGAVALLGGSVPFVLFFEGLARASSTDAAFVHKTLVVWVALLAVPLLHERVGVPHLLAIALLIGGQVLLAGDLTTLQPGRGEAMVLAATLLWAAEVIVAKRVLGGRVSPLTLGTARMGGGLIVLLGWAAVRGELGALTGLDAVAWGWALATGTLLSVYVATWYSALARAQAIDVTSILVFGAVITALLDRAVRGVVLPDPAGLVLVAAGTVCAVLAATRMLEPGTAGPTAAAP
jgi:drug/metabolite transporter (DMT)-like permease